ncbi:C40 family peptidase [Pedobacter sp. MC2016-24]|uniref:C40 family peptidase n=1 Tax=Pedobacter sp. MC2016-24 TaxID=2780090 RepID=UPI0018814B26|nr:NlpC/P60 family protein [Pedobacter sp. MC2016-24]MBE9598116.1 C40 family peptidase [Pedobacter sp. MC2016-24]
MNRLVALLQSRFKLSLVFVLAIVCASCGSRRHTTKSPTVAARTADAMSHLKSKKLYTFITDWTGVQYRLGGLDKKGIDCSGFALLLQKDIYGNTLPRRSRDQADAIREKDPGQLNEGDLIFFSFGGGAVDHVGVYLNNNYFVHASTTRGVVVDDLTLPVYQKSLVKAGSLKN